jgi:hypothetical protein
MHGSMTLGDVRINLEPLKLLEKVPRSVYNQWAARYRSFAQERFVKFSRGKGTWPPLAPSTIARRRKGRGRRRDAQGRAIGKRARVVAILRDTGTLFAALDVHFTRNPGQLQKDLPHGVQVGFGGPGKHPKAPMSVADLASIHHFGLGRVPARPIIVDPPNKVLNQMSTDVARYWRSVSG